LVSSAVGEKPSALEAMEMLKERARKGGTVVIDSNPCQNTPPMSRWSP